MPSRASQPLLRTPASRGSGDPGTFWAEDSMTGSRFPLRGPGETLEQSLSQELPQTWCDTAAARAVRSESSCAGPRAKQHGRSQPGPCGSRAPQAHSGHLGHCPHHPGHHCHHDLFAAVPSHCSHHLSHAGSSCPQWGCLRSSQEGQGRDEGSVPSSGLFPSQNSSRRDFGV